MKTPSFVMFFSAFLFAYFFANFPEAGSTINAIIKATLAAGAVFVLLQKIRVFITINTGVVLLALMAVSISAYVFEAGKEQRIGRKVIAAQLSPVAADGAWIFQNEGDKSPNSTILIGFNQTQLNVEKEFPSYRKIPSCNIQIPGSDKLLALVSSNDLPKTKFYWNIEASSNEGAFYYKLFAALPSQHYLFLRTPLIKDKTPQVEVVENARQYLDNGSYIDRACADAPYTYTKKAYSPKGVIKAEWQEKQDAVKLNEVVYDSNGKALNGQADAEFVLFVEEVDEFKNGFGKAGPLKCVGYYTYKEGMKHGPYEFYYPGRVARAFVGRYEFGKQVGTQKHYNPNGTLKESIEMGTPSVESSTLTR